MDMIPFTLSAICNQNLPYLTILGVYNKPERRIPNYVLLNLAISIIDIAQMHGGVLVTPVYDLEYYPKFDLMFTLLFSSQSRLNEFKELLRKS